MGTIGKILVWAAEVSMNIRDWKTVRKGQALLRQCSVKEILFVKTYSPITDILRKVLITQ